MTTTSKPAGGTEPVVAVGPNWGIECRHLRAIGLWGDEIRGAFTDMGVLAFAGTDIGAEMAGDQAAADAWFNPLRPARG